jgi:hypothetical protein
VQVSVLQESCYPVAQKLPLGLVSGGALELSLTILQQLFSDCWLELPGLTGLFPVTDQLSEDLVGQLPYVVFTVVNDTPDVIWVPEVLPKAQQSSMCQGFSGFTVVAF